MSKYIKLFSTHTEYDSYINGEGVILPNVSFCEDTKDVHYNPYVDPYNGHDYVEIGGLKWATMNVGATSITDYGQYFSWGDTQGYTASQVGSGEGQKYFGWEDYKLGNGGSGATDMTKYNSTDGKTVLEASDDAAQVNWGGSWRMPTNDDFNALSAATTNTWLRNYGGSGIAGRLFIDKTDTSKTLFFPAAGICSRGSVKDVGTNGVYLSSSLHTSDVTLCTSLGFFTTYCRMGGGNRFIGYSVRGVVG